MLTVPPELKLHGRTSKYILREAVEDIVPRAIIERRKAGFGVPIRTWLRRDLREMVDDLLESGAHQARGYFEPDGDPASDRRRQEGRADNTYRIWALLTLEMWQQAFLDSSPLARSVVWPLRPCVNV